jgi:hypothetical protein
MPKRISATLESQSRVFVAKLIYTNQIKESAGLVGLRSVTLMQELLRQNEDDDVDEGNETAY